MRSPRRMAVYVCWWVCVGGDLGGSFVDTYVAQVRIERQSAAKLRDIDVMQKKAGRERQGQAREGQEGRARAPWVCWWWTSNSSESHVSASSRRVVHASCLYVSVRPSVGRSVGRVGWFVGFWNEGFPNARGQNDEGASGVPTRLRLATRLRPLESEAKCAVMSAREAS